MLNRIKTALLESARIKEALAQPPLIGEIARIARRAISAYRRKRKLILFGNGGSAADAQHIATELVCRFEKERRSLMAIALTTNTSMLTAISNDYTFNRVFSRQVESCVSPGDVVIGISTSGNSENVLEGLRAARRRGAVVIGFSGRTGGKLKRLCHLCLCVPSENTARIQEGHITVGHILCGLIEDALFR